MSKSIRIAVVSVIAVAVFFVATASFAAGNLILNGDMVDASVPTTPDHWVAGGWDSTFGAASFTSLYPVAGPDGTDKAAQISIVQHSDGDAKWVFENVAVTPGALYTFKDSYKSDVTSYIIVGFTFTDATTRFYPMATLAATAGAWASTTQDFTPPVNAVSATVFHLIKTVGTLTTAHYSLTPFVTETEGLFDQGFVSLSFDDGWTTQYDTAWPMLVANNFKATFYLIGQALINGSYDLFAEPAQTIAVTSNANGTTWSPIYPDPTNVTYRFIDTYTSATASTITVSYTLANNTPSSTTTTIEAGTNARGAFVFDLPALLPSTPITIAHTGTALTAGNGALIEYGSGYLSTSQALDLANAGEEIGVHTVHHCALEYLDNSAGTATSTCAFPFIGNAQAIDEIHTAHTNIQSAVSPFVVNTLAYPYGLYNSNVESLAAGDALIGARSVDIGYNRKTTNPYALKVQSVDASTTVQTVQSWITTAVQNKFWLILVFHQIDNPATLVTNGEDSGTTPENLSAILSYLASNNVPVKTVAEGIAAMTAVVVPPPPGDTTPPTITIAGNNPAEVTVGTTYQDLGASVDDNVDHNLGIHTFVDGIAMEPVVVNTTATSTHTISYVATDSAGNTATSTRTVNVVDLILSGETGLTSGQNMLTVTWTTSHPATSRVILDTVSHTDASTTEAVAPNYGYATSTVEDSTMVTTHSITIVGLSAGTTYYFRPVSHGSPETFGDEKSATTESAPAPVNDPAPTGGGSPAPTSGGGGNGPVGNFGINAAIIPGGILNGVVLGTSTETTTDNSTVSSTTPKLHTFIKTLQVGSRGADVTELQKILIAGGYLKIAVPTGYYGVLTRAAVKAYQLAHGIDQAGIVGPITRKALNNGSVAVVFKEK